MTKKEADARQRFTDIVREYRAATVDYNAAICAADLLLRHGRTYSRIQEMHCNGVGTWYGESAQSFAKRQARFETRLEHRESLLEARIRVICAELGYTASFGGDPRGHTVAVVIPGYRDGEGVSVPTS